MEQEEIDLNKLHYDVKWLQKSLENSEVKALEREKKHEERTDLLTKHIQKLTKQTDILTNHIDDLNKLLFKNDIDPKNTLVARIQEIEEFNKMLNEARFKLKGSVATVMFAIGALGAIAGIISGIIMAIYNIFIKK
jgi:Na+/phosphate symporter